MSEAPAMVFFLTVFILCVAWRRRRRRQRLRALSASEIAWRLRPNAQIDVAPQQPPVYRVNGSVEP